MLFNSVQFAGFFAVVFGAYWLLNHRWQNRLLLLASCVFYGSWDARFLALMFASVSIDYVCARRIFLTSDPAVRKGFLALSLTVNVVILGFFKYFNFFAESLQAFLSGLGFSASLPVLQVILPVGISFYTFEAMSYCLDVYWRKTEPARSYGDYALFVAFFPHLVAGPIMKARDLIPQIVAPRAFSLEEFYKGCHLVTWGLFQKVFVADNLGQFVDDAFRAPPPHAGVHVVLAVYAFAFQILGDFAGYSNMARGLGKMLGFDLMVNFKFPYFSTNPRELWQRWHISLSNWLRDYLYIPLGGSRSSPLMTYRNLAIAMTIGGLWHGAKWTFVFWGVYHGLLLIAHRLVEPLFGRSTIAPAAWAAPLWKTVKVVFFFQLVCVGWLFFRAESMSQAWEMLAAVVRMVDAPFAVTGTLARLAFFIVPIALVEWYQYRKQDALALYYLPVPVRGTYYLAIVLLIVSAGVHAGNEFIYFQF
ncbi:MAG: MBOAT family O-acyltransferase [Vicinamibacterales bacterium]